MKHTPGPWTVSNKVTLQGDKLPHINIFSGSTVVAENLFVRDANLIAAAPGLLKACKAALITLIDDELYESTSEVRKTLEDAISKAEGRIK